ncbi:hypothetical protein QFZ41_003028 [Luteibacter sp. W1I16]|uniref:hypothetical protein n=1 Tax=Luteibacter sp. W1I16 TaxID=3373922 RepID=UPI003D1F3662
MYGKYVDGEPRRHRTALVIAILAGLLAFLLRWYFVTHAQVLETIDAGQLRGDAVQYYRYAWNIAHRDVFSSASPTTAIVVPDSFRDPGYPLLMAAIMVLTVSFPAFYAKMLLLQALLGAITVSLLVLAARDWLPSAGLAVSALLMAIWPHSIAITAYLVSETLVALLCASALLALRWAISSQAQHRYVVTGLAFGLTAITNAVFIPFGVVLAAVLWRRKLANGRLVLALALASLALPCLWGVRSTMLPPSASATSRAVTNFVQGSWPTYHVAYHLAARGEAESIDQLRGIQYEIDLLQNDPLAGLALMRHRMGELAVPYLRWYIGKPALLWGWDIRVGWGDIYVYATRFSPFEKGRPWAPIESACFVLNPVLMALGFIGALAALFLRRRDAIALACSSLALFITLVYGLLQSEPRYSIPLRGVEILLATWGAVSVAAALRARATTREGSVPPTKHASD